MLRGGSPMLEFVASAVVERASVHNMARLQARGGSVLRSSETAAGAVECASCGTQIQTAAVQYKYRLKIQVAYGESVVDAMLFDEVAQQLVGVSATQLRKLEVEHPSLPWLLEELLVGLRVSFSYQRGQDRAATLTSTTAADATKPKYTRDLKIVAIAPLARVLLPKPLIQLAMDALAQLSAASAHAHTQDDDIGFM